MRRYLVLVIVCLSVALLGAGHHRPVPRATPIPTAVPTPAPTPTPSDPVIVIYPFTVNGDADKDAGGKLATIFASSISQSGGIAVKPTTSGVARQDFLTDAKRLGADYYISGFITPLGNEVALVEQVVSTFSGTVVYANTAQIVTYADASAQAQVIRTAVLGHSGRVVAEYNRPVAEPSTGPTASSGKEVNIVGLFRRHPKRPVPGSAVGRSAPRSLRSVTVVRVGGSAPPAERGAASRALVGSFKRLADARLSAIVSEDVAKDAAGICGAERNISVASGSLTLEQTRFRRGSRAAFTLRVYTCDGSLLFQDTARNASIERAVDAMVDEFVRTHPA